MGRKNMLARIYYSIVVVFLDYEDLNEEHDIGTRDWKERLK